MKKSLNRNTSKVSDIMKKKVKISDLITFIIFSIISFIILMVSSNIAITTSDIFNKITMGVIALLIYLSFTLYVISTLKENGKKKTKKKS